MTRALAPYLRVEVALLGLFEFGLSFVLAYIMLCAPGVLTLLRAASPMVSPDGAGTAALLAVTVAATAVVIGLYRLDVLLDRRRLLLNAGVAVLVAFPPVLLVASAASGGLSAPDVLWLAKMLALWFAAIVLSRLAFSLFAHQEWLARRVLVVGAEADVDRMCELLRGRRERLFLPVRVAVGSPTSGQRLQQHRGVWCIVAAGADTDLCRELRRHPALRRVPVFDEPSFKEQQLGRIDLEQIGAVPLIDAIREKDSPGRRIVKRACDIATSLVLLVLTLPLMLLVAALIRIESPGPVLYRQQRAGQHGKPFTLYKFRSMAADAEAGGSPLWAQKRDPRITRIGALIRPTRIDELPQLFNVLAGQMSVVGPRPERPHFVTQLARVLPHYDLRSVVKPGITGWAQVNFPYGASVEDARQKLAFDLYYVKHRNLWLDLFILLSTVRVIVFREGAR